MPPQHEVTAEQIEADFGAADSARRFANFCNAVILCESSPRTNSLPTLSEKPGPDGGMDGEWTVDLVPGSPFFNPFARIGWNVFQFKARSLAGGARSRAISSLKSSVKGALDDLVKRLQTAKEASSYVLFTNVQLDLRTETKTKRGATLNRNRANLLTAIKWRTRLPTEVSIIDGAQLAASANSHPALRLTYFSGPTACSWDEKWDLEAKSRNYGAIGPFTGRKREVDEIAAWIEDPAVKVITIFGPSGMGKTRLALECTRRNRWRTTVVDVIEEFERWSLTAFKLGAESAILIVEDPDAAQAERLARKAVATEGVKLVFTFPNQGDIPILQLTDSQSVRSLALQPLPDEDAKALLSAVGAPFSGEERDWVLLQAGGNPEVLLGAASLGSDLRAKAGTLKRNLSQVYQRRIEKELGASAFSALRLVSPLQWAKVTGEKTDLPVLMSGVGLTDPAVTTVDRLRALEKLGYIRRRGDYAMAFPPIFAAVIVEDLYSDHPGTAATLFAHLGKPGRERFLERIATAEVNEEATFWDPIFTEALGTPERLLANADLLDDFARAAPSRTMGYLSIWFDHFPASLRDWRLLAALRELAYNPPTADPALRLLEKLALDEDSSTPYGSATKLFCECFVHWFTPFPISFQTREQWVRQMVDTGDPRHDRLAAQVILTVTEPPRVLSGYSVHARRLGPPPPVQFWSQVHHYLCRFFELRIELCERSQNFDILRGKIGRSLQELKNYLPVSRILDLLEHVMDLLSKGKVSVDERELRELVHWLEEDLAEICQKASQDPGAAELSRISERLEGLRRHFDDGPFWLRLKIGLASDFDDDWTVVNGRRLYGFERRCRELAGEVVRQTSLMSDDAWGVLVDPASIQAPTFLIALGELDTKRVLLDELKRRVGDRHWDWVFGLYLKGLQTASPELVDECLDAFVSRPEFQLSVMRVLGPTAGNRNRLLRFIKQRLVDPFGVATMLTSPLWVEGLPVSEMEEILEYVVHGPVGWSMWVIRVLHTYVHCRKALPEELLSAAEKALTEPEPLDLTVSYQRDQVAIAIARTSIERAVQLVKRQISTLASLGSFERRLRWNPCGAHGVHVFWIFLCDKYPARVCRECFAMRDHWASLDDVHLTIDLEKHGDELFRVASENEEKAVFLAGEVTAASKGFFSFAYRLMDAYPSSDKLPAALARKAIYKLGYPGDWDGYKEALAKIEFESRSPSTPRQHLLWLQGVKAKIQTAVAVEAHLRGPISSGEPEHLGWS